MRTGCLALKLNFDKERRYEIYITEEINEEHKEETKDTAAAE